MKKNKLLAPFLGLATVATVVAPIATSCANGEVDTAHVKATPITEKKSVNGVVQYLLELDSSDYDKDNFTVTLSISEKDKSGAKASDFSVTDLSLDGNHMVVDVKYVNENDPFTEDTQVRLNINVKYGSKWTNSVDVKFNYLISSGNELVYDANEHALAIPEATYPIGKEIKFTLTYGEVLKYQKGEGAKLPNTFSVACLDPSISIYSACAYPNDDSSKPVTFLVKKGALYFDYTWKDIFPNPPSEDEYATFVVTFASASTATDFKGIVTSSYIK